MPEKKGLRKRINWTPVRLAYIAGKTPSQLSKQFGIPVSQITNTQSRQGWTKNKQAVKNRVDSSVVKLASDSIVLQRKRFIAMMQRDALRKAEHYTTKLPDPEDWKDAANAERALSSVSSRGRIALGLDDTQSHLHLHFGVPDQGQSDAPQLTDSTQVIDVETVKPE